VSTTYLYREICAVPLFAVLGGLPGRDKNVLTTPDGVTWRLTMSLWTDLPKNPKIGHTNPCKPELYFLTT